MLSSDKGKDLSRIVNKNILFSYFLKGIGVCALYLLVPLLVNSLGKYSYGVWITLSSFLNWFNFFDVGLGHGLRNKLIKAFAEENYKTAREYIKAAYIILGAVSILLMGIILLVVFNVDWASLLNIRSDLNATVQTVLMYLLIGVSLQLLLKNINHILLADQRAALSTSISTFEKGIILLLVWLFLIYGDIGLINLSIIYMVVPIVVLVCYTVILFTSKYKRIKPSVYGTAFNFEIGKSITGLGFKFFILQVGAVLLYSTDQVIITMFLGPEYVTEYDVAYKYFQIVMTASTIFLAPYWSAFGDAFERGDKTWINNHISRLVKLWIIGTLLLILMVIFADEVYRFWIGGGISIDNFISITMAVYVSTFMLQSIFINFINGVGKLRVQIIHIGASSIINIPLSIILATKFELGVGGVVLATVITQVMGAVIYPIQYRKIMKNAGSAIWHT